MSLIVLKNSDGTKSLDLTRSIPMKTYQVNVEENNEEWTDSNYTKHFRLLAEKVTGTFKLKFKSIADYANFMTFLSTNKDSSSGLIKADVFCMYPYTTKSNINVKLTFNPVDDLPMIADGQADGFQVTIEES